MKKIGLFLSSDRSSGGIFQYSLSILDALRSLPRNDYSVIVAFLDDRWREDIGADLECLPVKMSAGFRGLAAAYTAAGLSHRLWLRVAPRLSEAVRTVVAQSCDLWIFPGQDLWSSRFPVPTLAAIHDLMHRYEPDFPEASAKGRARYRDNYFKNLCVSARGILVDSELGKRHVQESYGAVPEKLFALPYVPPAYLSESRQSPDFDSRYQLPQSFLFYPARFWRHKNHLGLLEALAIVQKDLSDVHLVLAGSPTNEYRAVCDRVNRLNLQRNVHFVGYVPDQDLPEFYRRARALVFPTFFGPTNIPPMEAFAIGCPVAASGVYAMPEQARGAALLFDPHSIEEMAFCIRRLWCDEQLQKRLIVKGKQITQLWGQTQFRSAVHEIIHQCVFNFSEASAYSATAWRGSLGKRGAKLPSSL